MSTLFTEPQSSTSGGSTSSGAVPHLEKPIDIHNPVLDSVRTGSALKPDAQHAFNQIIDNYSRYAKQFRCIGGDGVERTLFQIEGSLNGKVGVFEWIVDNNPLKGVVHRRFIEGIKVTGIPNMHPWVQKEDGICV